MKKFLIIFISFIFVLVGCTGGSNNSSNPPTLSSAKDITAFSLNGTQGKVGESTITVEMPYESTTVESLVATFTTSGKSVTVGDTIQDSGKTPNDFTNPVIYKVYAEDKSTKNYTVKVTVSPPSFAKDITAFSLNGTQGKVGESTITVVMPYGTTTVESLVATFTTSGKSVTVGDTIQDSGKTPNDFTNPVIYKVYAEDKSTKNYTVTVSVANTRLFAVGLNGTSLVSDDDGISWISQSSGTSATITGITVNSSGKFVAVGYLQTILNSDDGINWTRIKSPSQIANIVGIAVNNNDKFVGVGDLGLILSSDDRISWTSQSSGTSQNLYGIIANGSKFYAVGDNGTILSSNDGISWTRQSSGTTQNLQGITVNSSGKFVAVGTAGTIMASDDGINWTRQNSGITQRLYGVTVNSQGTFVAVGANGAILSSDDGISWIKQSSGTTQNIEGITVNNNGKFVAVGTAGTILSSDDGISWIKQSSGTDWDLMGIIATPK